MIPKSVQKERIQEFKETELLNWKLSSNQMRILDNLPEKGKICWDPEAVL